MPNVRDISAWALGQGSGSLLSGDLASGVVTTWDLSSGIIANHAQEVIPVYSGGLWTLISAEIISGVRAVYIDVSGHVAIAMAAVSGRMPALGICEENVLSGIQVNVHSVGFYQFTSGMADFSGYLGYRVWVGRSGGIVAFSGSWNSGGYGSGDLGQVIGQVVNSGGVIFNVWHNYWSGGPLGFAAGGRK